ncbi:MAG TPA: NAD(P)H-dependent oxidoreductase subunit E, partial [Ramlibacter sp.]|nr:NAD(P)H-dependent oxidoreductase subunit E [Ramlibacter sp.]
MNPDATIPLASPEQLRQRLRNRGKLKGRQPEEQALAEVRECIGPRPAQGHRRDLLIEHLHRLNDRFGALREPHLVALAREMNVPMAEVHEVATFYHHFEVVRADAQVPALTVRVCEGLACELAGAGELLQRLPGRLGAQVRVVAAPCIGRCEQAPAVAVHQAAVGRATAEDVARVVAARGAQPASCPPSGAVFDPVDYVERSLPVAADGSPPPYTDYATYRSRGGYALPAAVARGERNPDEVLVALEDSGLRGLGGAGFPAGRKWRIVRGEPAPRLLAVNIDEGEPGTFKDRTYLERDPHRFLEGVLVAAQVVGIQAVYLYLRDEYHDARALLEAELAKLTADPPCPLPRIELRRGAGAYICGEESAMVESIEGRRGEPRMRP